MAVTSPDLTNHDADRTPQRMCALDRANDIRLLKASIRRGLRRLGSAESVMEASRILREIPAGTEHLEAGELLLAVRKMGKVKARPILSRWGVSVWCPLTEMTERQRRGIASDLEDLSRGRSHGHLGPLSETSRHILIEIARADEMGVTARDLTGRLGVSALRSGALLNSLRIRGFITKERLTSKSSLWLITAAGRREAERPQVVWTVT